VRERATVAVSSRFKISTNSPTVINFDFTFSFVGGMDEGNMFQN
jgi:hypothetical protein